MKDKFAFFHINKGNFKDTENHYWLVGYNEGGIGTPIMDLTVDVCYFLDKQKKEAEELADKVLKEIYVDGFSDGELTLRLKSQAALTAEIERLKAEIDKLKGVIHQ